MIEAALISNGSAFIIVKNMNKFSKLNRPESEPDGPENRNSYEDDIFRARSVCHLDINFEFSIITVFCVSIWSSGNLCREAYSVRERNFDRRVDHS